jgi:hypothetical protein
VRVIGEETIGVTSRGFSRLAYLIKDDFFWQSTVVLAASMAGCGFSYLYQIYAGRCSARRGTGLWLHVRYLLRRSNVHNLRELYKKQNE